MDKDIKCMNVLLNINDLQNEYLDHPHAFLPKPTTLSININKILLPSDTRIDNMSETMAITHALFRHLSCFKN